MTARPYVEGLTDDPFLSRLILHPIVHEALSALRFIGMRSRLYCPGCKAMGTWKPHGFHAAQKAGDRPVRRWLCKWCGLYLGPEGWLTCVPNTAAGYWDLPWNVEGGRTPAQVIAESEIAPINPWRG